MKTTDLENDDREIKVVFEVVCRSPISMQEGDTLLDRVKSYIHQCFDAMDDSMRHWGDHYHDIELVEVKIMPFEEDDKEITVDLDDLDTLV